jgi:two-component system chemotaxis response regulator CheV
MNTLNSKNDGILLQSGNNEVEFIEFNVGGVNYGINVAKVERVLARPTVTITRMDNDGTAMLGTIYVQDMPIQLIDLRHALEMDPLPEEERVDENRQLILVTKFYKMTTSFLIDKVNKIHRTSWAEFEPIDASMTGDVLSSYVTGTIKIDNRVIVILDLEHLMLEFAPEMATKLEAVTIDEPCELTELRGKLKIIYAEDSGVIRKMMLNTLKSGGYTNVIAFEHGRSAYEYILELNQRFQSEGGKLSDYIGCIITDIEMPQMDGLTLCKNIKDMNFGDSIPSVVVYSSLINESMTKKCESVGADAQVSKPHGTDIIDVLDRLCLK